MRSSTTRGLRIAAALLAVPAILLTSACSSGDKAADKGADGAAGGKADSSAPLFSELPQAVQDAGVLNAASYIAYPPFESYADDNKTVVGVDRDIADALEKQLGVKINFNNVPFDSIIPGLAAKRYDFAMSAMSDTVERQKQVDFVDYYAEGESIILPEGHDGSIKVLDDLCGRTIGNVKGTTTAAASEAQSEKCVADGKKPINDTVFPGQNEAVLAVSNKRVDALLLDYTTATYIAENTDSGLEVLPPYMQESIFGIVFPKGAEELHLAVQAGLEAMKEDGTYQAILDDYNLGSSAIEEFTINGVTE